MNPRQPQSQLDKFDGWDISQPQSRADLPIAALAPSAFSSVAEWPCHHADSKASDSKASSIAGSIAGAALGTIAGGIVWLAVALSVIADMGYMAVLLGILAGNGARLGGGASTSVGTRISALLGTVLGVLVCKYLFFAYEFIATARNAESYFAPETWLAFRTELPWWFGPFELFWCGIALIGAWMASSPSDTRRS